MIASNAAIVSLLRLIDGHMNLVVLTILSFFLLAFLQSKIVLLFALVAGASAFTSPVAFTAKSTAVFGEEPKLGAGGMADTRDPEAYEDEDPRKSISEAPSFEEYMKQRAAEGN